MRKTFPAHPQTALKQKVWEKVVAMFASVILVCMLFGNSVLPVVQATAPTFTLTEPDGTADTADKTYTIKWSDADPDSDAKISLYYDTDKTGADGTLIVANLSEDSGTDTYTWDTSKVPKGNYYVYGVINDGVNPAVTSYSSGMVTVNHPSIPIKTCEELQNIKNNLSRNYHLTNNIDCSNTKNWNGGKGFDPIGDNINKFTGSFQGDNYVVSDLYINRTDKNYYAGLFGYTSETAHISNLRLKNVNINAWRVLGGLVGRNEGVITNSSAASTINGNYFIGGLVGVNAGSIKNSYSSGSVNAEERDIGGLAGNNSCGSIANSYSTASVKGTYYVGGLVGFNHGGRLCETNPHSGATIVNSYAAGIVNGTAASHTGGLVGYNYPGTVTNSYYDSNTSGQSDTGKGNPKATSEMQKRATFVNWDFTNVWKIDEKNGYPKFQWATVRTPTLVSSGSTGKTNAHDIVVDTKGNSYLVGYYKGTKTKPNGTQITAQGDADQLIEKYDPTGKLLWGKYFGGPASDTANGVQLSPNEESLYLVGSFSTNLKDPATGTTLFAVSSKYRSDAVILKLSASTGAIEWQQRLAGKRRNKGHESATAVAVSATGRVFVGGKFTKNIYLGKTLHTTTKWRKPNAFLTELSPATGAVLWGKTWGGSASEEHVALATDNNALYVAGEYTSLTLSGKAIPSQSYDSYLLKYTLGNQASEIQQEWIRTFGGPGYDKAYSVAAKNNRIAVTGYYANTLAVTADSQFQDSATNTLSAVGGKDIFLVEFDQNGKALLVKGMGSAGNEVGNDVALDASGQAYLTGYFSNSFHFGGKTLEKLVPKNAYFLKISPTGTELTANYLKNVNPNTGAREGEAITLTESGSLQATGYFYNETGFEQKALSSQGQNDVFLLRTGF